MTKSLRDEAAAAASRMGFSSLQEAVRVFLTQLPTKRVSVSFEEPPVQLSAKAIKRYNKISDEIKSGKAKLKTFSDEDSIESIMNYLSS